MATRKHHPKNVERAEWATEALEVFSVETYGGRKVAALDADTETCVQDLITDLLHFWHQTRKRKEATPEELMKRALWMFNDELETPEG